MPFDEYLARRQDEEAFRDMLLSMGPRGSGQLEEGNIDLNNRPIVQNNDGSVSTVRSMSINVDGKEVLIPTISDDGRVMSPDEAVEQFRRTGKNLGVFDSPESATRYAKQLSNRQGEYARSRQAIPDGHFDFNRYVDEQLSRQGRGRELLDQGPRGGSLPEDRAPRQTIPEQYADYRLNGRSSMEDDFRRYRDSHLAQQDEVRSGQQRLLDQGPRGGSLPEDRAPKQAIPEQYADYRVSRPTTKGDFGDPLQDRRAPQRQASQDFYTMATKGQREYTPEEQEAISAKMYRDEWFDKTHKNGSLSYYEGEGTPSKPGTTVQDVIDQAAQGNPKASALVEALGRAALVDGKLTVSADKKLLIQNPDGSLQELEGDEALVWKTGQDLLDAAANSKPAPQTANTQQARSAQAPQQGRAAGQGGERQPSAAPQQVSGAISTERGGRGEPLPGFDKYAKTMYEFNSLIDGDTKKYDDYLMGPVLRDLRRAQTRNADAAAYGHYARAAKGGAEAEEGKWEQMPDGSWAWVPKNGPEAGYPTKARDHNGNWMDPTYAGREAEWGDARRSMGERAREIDPNVEIVDTEYGPVARSDSYNGGQAVLLSEFVANAKPVKQTEVRNVTPSQPNKRQAISTQYDPNEYDSLSAGYGNLGTVRHRLSGDIYDRNGNYIGRSND